MIVIYQNIEFSCHCTNYIGTTEPGGDDPSRFDCEDIQLVESVSPELSEYVLEQLDYEEFEQCAYEQYIEIIKDEAA